MKALNLDSFFNEALSWMPDILKVILVLLIGWLIAKGLQKLTKKFLNKTNLDDRLLGRGSNNISSEVLLSKMVYYLVMAIVLMSVLNMIGATSALEPLRDMVSEFLGAIPNIIKAVVIGFIGYVVAQTVSALVNLSGNVIDRIALRAGVSDTLKVTNVLRNVVFIIIIIPFAIAALDALQIPSISAPATSMLNEFMGTIPNIIAASLILVFFYYGGRFITGLLGDLLRSLGTDEMSNKLGFGQVLGSNQSASKTLSQLAFFFIMFFGVITAVNKLGFIPLTEILENILGHVGSIFFGLIIFAAGSFLANIAFRTLHKEGESSFIPSLAKGAVLALFFAMGLRTMGFANEIVHLAFGLILGAIAVAFALSFGLGGQKAAGDLMSDILGRFKSKK